MDAQDQEYDNYVREDPTRRFQFNYNENVAMANDFPEAQVDTNALTVKRNNYANAAPGEGQIPTSVLTEKVWDIKTYSNL